MYRKIKFTSTVALIVLMVLVAVIPALAQGHMPLEDPIPEAIADGPVRIRLTPLADGMTAPNWGTQAPGCPPLKGRLFVTDQPGILWSVNLATGEKDVALDVSDLLVSLGVAGPGTFDERGLLGVAFHPDYADNGLLYTYTSEPVNGPADFSTIPVGESANHQSLVREWVNPDPCNPESVVDPTSSRELLRIDEPQFNHDAGTVAFGPDGMLYIALGDGGAADDQGVGHVPGGNGQAPDNVLGTILRIDPQGDNAANGQYGIPADNPFVGQADFLDEIYAYGLRNPFRFSFDSETGEMYLTDVGQNDIEELNIGMAGANYGWNLKEGSFCFDPNGEDRGFVYDCAPGEVPDDLVDPIAEYDHDEGIAIVGGFVYNGKRIPQLKGRYVFGDFLQPAIGSGRLFFLHANDEIREFRLAGQDTLGMRLLGFGQDHAGELYVMANMTGTPFGETGVVLRIAPAVEDFVFQARLSGAQEVPPVETDARGQALFSFKRDLSALDYKLAVVNIENVVASHIHCAPEGVNGPVGVTLFSGGPVSLNGLLAQDRVMAPDEGNSCGWETLEDVAAALRSGNGYVNVHTLANPPGEIRGQIR